jgi:hypothetical protein
MVDESNTEQHQAFGIAVDMITAKYHDADAEIITDRVASFVTSGPTAEDDGRRMGLICENLARLGGQLADAIGQLSPTAIEQFLNKARAVSRGEATV